MRHERGETMIGVNVPWRRALLAACVAGDAIGVRTALERGADPSSVAKRGVDALMLAASHGGAWSYAEGCEFAWSSLGAAAEEYHECAGILLAAGANALAKDAGGHTALMRAAADSKASAGLIAGLARASNVNEGNAKGRTALMASAVAEHEEALEALLSVGGIEVSKRDFQGSTAFGLACLGHRRAALMLFDRMADVDRLWEAREASERLTGIGEPNCVREVLDWLGAWEAGKLKQELSAGVPCARSCREGVAWI